jgi:CHAT domain-containing protein/lipopolysaccharide biosynthesis regulator YciM
MKLQLFTLLFFIVFAASAQKSELTVVDSLIRSGKFTEAESALENMKGDEALIKTHYGLLYMMQNRYDLALEDLQTAVDIFEKENQSGSLEAAEALVHLGNVYRSTGKYSQAQEQLNRALMIRQEKLPATHELIAAVYNDLGLAYIEVDRDKSIDYYEKALETYRKLHGENDPKIAIGNTNLGIVYTKEKLFGDAINYYETASKIWEKVYAKPHANKALVLMNLGQTYSAMGDQKAALAYYEKSLTMYEAASGKKHPEVAFVQNLLGNEKLAQEKYDEALTHYQKALEANIPDFTSTSILETPSTKEFYNGRQLLISLTYKAQALEKKYFGKTLNRQDLLLGLTTLQACDSLIDRLRQSATNESDKIALGAIANEVYGDGVRIAYTLSDVSFKGRENYRELSFYFAEKSKSAVLQEAISDTNAKSFANIPNELLEEEKNLKAAIALIAQKLAQKPAEEEEKYLRETIFSLNRAYQDFTKHLENQYPEYFNLKFNSATPSIQQLQSLISAKTAFISYFMDESNNRLYIYVISKNKFTIESKAIPKEYDKYITGLRNSLFFQEINTFRVSASKLYNLLVPDKIPRSIDDLVIIPTGRMGVIPFETLLSKETDETDFKALPYLLLRYTIRYEFSAGLALQKKHTNAGITSALFCAPVTFPDKDGLVDLPGTEVEVNTISALFKQKNISSSVLLNNKASETSIKSGSLKNYSLIHLATHGVVDENSPELSRIFLQTDTEAEDGNLFAGEIYNLELKADLVALSACQTGLGKISKGEGVIGLSRALVYAGAKNIIVSFWSVADESTAQLMTDFYKQLLENPSATYSQDLRKAKLALMKGNYAAPYYWAPFILIGF